MEYDEAERSEDDDSSEEEKSKPLHPDDTLGSSSSEKARPLHAEETLGSSSSSSSGTKRKRSLDEDEKRKADRRAANRESASRSRQRRKDLVENLQKTVRNLSKDNSELQKSQNQLRMKLECAQLENKFLREWAFKGSNGDNTSQVRISPLVTQQGVITQAVVSEPPAPRASGLGALNGAIHNSGLGYASGITAPSQKSTIPTGSSIPAASAPALGLTAVTTSQKSTIPTGTSIPSAARLGLTVTNVGNSRNSGPTTVEVRGLSDASGATQLGAPGVVESQCLNLRGLAALDHLISKQIPTVSQAAAASQATSTVPTGSELPFAVAPANNSSATVSNLQQDQSLLTNIQVGNNDANIIHLAANYLQSTNPQLLLRASLSAGATAGCNEDIVTPSSVSESLKSSSEQSDRSSVVITNDEQQQVILAAIRAIAENIATSNDRKPNE